MHDSLAWSVVRWGLGVCVLTELAIYFRAPWILARLAVLPLGVNRRIPLSAQAREALFAEMADAASYREPAARRFDVARLGLETKMVLADAVGRFYPTRGFATARAPYRLHNQATGVARLDIRESGGVVVLTARFIPLTWLTTAALASTGAVLAVAEGGLTSAVARQLEMGVLLVAFNLVLTFLFSRARTAKAAEQVASEIERALLAAGT